MAPPLFVSSDWLAEHQMDTTLAVVDTRPPFFYSQGHLEGALNLPLFLIAGSGQSGDALRSRLGAIGISPDHHVVLYDDGGSPTATHAAWLLISVGHPAVSVLDGGITKWASENREIDYVPSTKDPVTYETQGQHKNTEVLYNDVRAAIEDPNIVIVDVRSPSEYLGAQVTAQRNGHIPGAVNIEWSNNLEAKDGIIRLRHIEDLRALYEEAGVTPDKQVIAYCQSGNRSTHTWLTLKALGYPLVFNYAAGWQEWGNRRDSPIEEA